MVDSKRRAAIAVGAALIVILVVCGGVVTARTLASHGTDSTEPGPDGGGGGAPDIAVTDGCSLLSDADAGEVVGLSVHSFSVDQMRVPNCAYQVGVGGPEVVHLMVFPQGDADGSDLCAGQGPQVTVVADQSVRLGADNFNGIACVEISGSTLVIYANDENLNPQPPSVMIDLARRVLERGQ